MTHNKDDIFDDIRKKMEAVGFKFEKKQKPHFQHKRENELKFVHPELNDRLSKGGRTNKATKYYLKPISDDKNSEIGLTTGTSTQLTELDEIQPPNAVDTHGSTPAWVNRPHDYSLDRLLESIDRYIDNNNFGTLDVYYEKFGKEIKLAEVDTQATRLARLEVAKKQPDKISVWTSVYRRNPDVVAEVLARATGVCEACGEKAPFLRKGDNSPYLEVHHIVQLSEGGDDTVENAIGVCPNCHRRAHFG